MMHGPVLVFWISESVGMPLSILPVWPLSFIRGMLLGDRNASYQSLPPPPPTSDKHYQLSSPYESLRYVTDCVQSITVVVWLM